MERFSLQNVRTTYTGFLGPKPDAKTGPKTLMKSKNSGPEMRFWSGINSHELAGIFVPRVAESDT